MGDKMLDVPSARKKRDLKIYKFAEWLHDIYESSSIEHKWKTNKRCNLKDFKDLPFENKGVMLDVSEQILIRFTVIKPKKKEGR